MQDAIVNLIASTTTTTGRIVGAALDTQVYETGIKVTDEELAQLNITRGQALRSVRDLP